MESWDFVVHSQVFVFNWQFELESILGSSFFLLNWLPLLLSYRKMEENSWLLRLCNILVSPSLSVHLHYANSSLPTIVLYSWQGQYPTVIKKNDENDLRLFFFSFLFLILFVEYEEFKIRTSFTVVKRRITKPKVLIDNLKLVLVFISISSTSLSSLPLISVIPSFLSPISSISMFKTKLHYHFQRPSQNFISWSGLNFGWYWSWSELWALSLETYVGIFLLWAERST